VTISYNLARPQLTDSRYMLTLPDGTVTHVHTIVIIFSIICGKQLSIYYIKKHHYKLQLPSPNSRIHVVSLAVRYMQFIVRWLYWPCACTVNNKRKPIFSVRTTATHAQLC